METSTVNVTDQAAFRAREEQEEQARREERNKRWEKAVAICKPIVTAHRDKSGLRLVADRVAPLPRTDAAPRYSCPICWNPVGSSACRKGGCK